jgi:hypothetical protein
LDERAISSSYIKNEFLLEVNKMANETLNLTNFIVDRVISGVGYKSDDTVLFKMDQCQNTSITCGSESTEIVDNVGSPIMTLYRSKTCEISGENAILDLNLTAVQMGAEKNVASSSAKIVVPAQEIFEAPEAKSLTGQNTDPKYVQYKLKNTPVAIPKYVYTLNDDSSLGEKYEYGTSAAAGKFTYDEEKNIIVLPDSVAKGTQMFVSYEHETASAVEIVNSANKFPSSCKLVLRVLGYNPCNKDNKLGAYIIFPSFEMSPDFDLSLNVGEAQSWGGKASQDYCSKDKRLMSIVVVDEDDDTF